MNQFDMFKSLVKKFAQVWMAWHTPENLEKQHEAADNIEAAVKIGLKFYDIAHEVFYGESSREMRSPGVESAMINEIADELRRGE